MKPVQRCTGRCAICFGNSQTSTTQSSSNNSYTPASWLSGAAQNNLNFASNLQSKGFSPYSGQQVADFSPQQTQSFGMGNGIAGAVTPAVQLAGTGLENYLNTTQGPAPTVAPQTIASNMSPYMNQYVSMALQPQLQQAANAYMLQSQALNGQATSAGAFGDPRTALLQGNLGLNYALENQGLVGNAYNAAFNTAIGAGAQDTANNLQGQITNAGLKNTWLANELAGVNAGFGQGTTATNLENQLGAQQTAQGQAGLNALYNQWLMGEQYPFQTTQLMNSTIGAATPAAPSTSNSSSTQTTSTPNNSGWGMLGSVAGSALGNLILPGVGGALGGSLGGALGGAAGGGAGAPLNITPYGGSTPGYNYGGFNTTGGYYAEGGDPPVGKPSVVGEKGPELFVPKEAGTVVPYEKVKEAMVKKKAVRTDGLARQLGARAA